MANPKRSFRKTVAIVLLAVFLSYLLLSLLGSAIVFRILFRRSEYTPENLEWVYGGDVDPARYPRTAVEFPSGDNTLRGWLYGPETGAEGLVVLVHGLGGGADSHLAAALYFADHGWRALCFDGTGTRSSDGDGIVGLSQMKLDLLAALDYVAARWPEERVVLYGHSLGAYAAAAVLDDRPFVRAAVCISAFDSPLETMYYHARRRAGPLAALGYPFLVLRSRLVFGAETDESAAAAINASGAAVLLVAGADDAVVPAEISLYRQREEITNPNTVFLYLDGAPRSAHSTAWLSEAGAEYYLEKAAERDALRRESGGRLAGPALEAFLDGLDRPLLCQLDEDFMAAVLRFYRDAA